MNCQPIQPLFLKLYLKKQKDIQVNKLTDVVVNSATEFFGMMVASKKKNKRWWSKDINKARKAAKNAQLI